MKEIKTFFCTIFYMLFFILPLIAQSTRPIVSSIATSVSDDNTEIIVSWTIPENAIFTDIDYVRIYRQDKEFSEEQDFSNAQLIGTVNPLTTSIDDPVPDNKNYWYAIIAQKKDGTLFDILVPSVNTTVLPIKLHNTVPNIEFQQEEIVKDLPKKTPKNDMRETPLPRLHILPLQTKEEAGTISPQALDAAQKLENQSILEATPTPFIFDKEQQGQNTTGDDYSLFYIIDSTFQNKDWSLAQKELTQFLQVARPDEVTARANFYIGECLYFQNNYKEAVNYFLNSEKIYKPISRKWLEKTINKFNYNKTN